MPTRITRVGLSAVVGPFKQDVRSGKREVTDLRQEAERFSKGRYEASLKADGRQARTELSALEKRLQAFAKTPVDQRVNLDTDEARDRMQALQARLAEFGTHVSDARVNVDDRDAQNKISRVEASLLALGSKVASPDIDLEGVAAAEAQLGTLESHLQRYDGSDYRAQVHVDGTLAATRQASALIDTLAMLGPTVVPMAAAATPALAGLTSMLSGAAVGAGVTAFAFSGVGDALEAMGDAEVAAASNAQESARTQVLASQQITDARRGVIDAQRDAAESAQDGSRQIADARRGVIDAERAAAQAARDGARDIADAQAQVTQARRDAADAARDAAQRVRDAEESLADSHERVEDALADLHDARRQAIADLRELREETRDNALDVESAEISVLRARERLAEVTADETATELDLRAARLSVAEAEERLSDARRDARQDQAELSRAEKDGIRNAAGVVDARDQVAAAHEGVRDAQLAVADAQRDAAQVQRESAARIAEAIDGVAEAREQAAQRNADAQRQISEAQRGLMQASIDAARARADSARRIQDAERALQRAMVATRADMAKQSTEAADLAEKMAALGPAGREFVEFLHSVRPEMQQIQDIAQAGMLPGVEDGIRDWLSLMPRWESLTRNTATALGALAREGGDALTDPFWRRFFGYIDTEANDILLDTGRALGNLTTGFAGMVMALDPLADDFRSSFLGMSRDFSHWGRTLSSNEGYREFVRYTRRVTPEVWDTLGQVAEALLAVAEAAAPIGEATLPVIQVLANILETVAESPAGPVLIGAAVAMSTLNRAVRLYEGAKHMRIVELLRGTSAEGPRAARGLREFSAAAGRMGVVGAAAIGIGEIVSGLGDLQRVSRGVTGPMREFRDIQDQIAASNLGKYASELGIDLDRLARDLHRNGTEGEYVKRVMAQLAGKSGTLEMLYDSFTISHEAADLLGIELGDNAQGAHAARLSLAQLIKALDEQKGSTRGATADTRSNSRATQANTREIRDNIEAMRDRRTQALANENAEISYQQSIDDARRSLRQNGQTLDITTAKGRENRLALLGMAESWNRQGDAAKSTDGAHKRAIETFVRAATRMGMNAEEAKAYANRLYEIPGNVDTDVDFKDRAARIRARDYRRYVNEELDKIRDEDVRISLRTIRYQSKARSEADNFFAGTGYKPPGGGRGALPPKMAGAVGGGAVIPQMLGSTRSVDKATNAIATDVHQSTRAKALEIQEALREAWSTLGPPGRAGRVLPKGSYSIGTPYLGYTGHYGADYPAPGGTPVYSPWPGRITASYDIPGSNRYNSTPYASYGRVIKIDHNNGLSTLYAHLSERLGRIGEVAAGQMIGRVGTTGNSTGDHLHFEARRNGATINPAQLNLFDQGGRWRSGTAGVNLSGKDELVLTHDQASALFPGFARGGEVVSQPQPVFAEMPAWMHAQRTPQTQALRALVEGGVHFNGGSDATAAELMQALDTELRVLRMADL